MGLLKALRIRIMNFMIFFLIVVLLPGLPPRTTFPYKEFVVAPPKELKGALEPNFHLEGAERLLEGRIAGPECLLVRNNEIYTGIHGGEIIKLTSNHITHVAKFGQPCMDKFEEAQCGRPLGMAFDTQGNNLLVADAYYGLWQVDLTTHKKKLLVSPDQELPGKEIARRAKTFNSVAVNKEGDIFYTDSSSDFSIQDLIYASFANPSGRLFKYNRAKNVSEVLLDEVFFANGLALNPTEDFIVMAETGAMRLTKYHLKGPKAGQSEVFVDGLPGMPDNLTPDAEGLWVPIVSSADSDHPSTFSLFSRFPTIRLFLARILALFELPFHFFNSVYPNKFSQRFTHFVGHGEMALLLAPRRASVLRVDWNGNIVGSLHGFDKSVAGISHVLEFQDHLYLGSPFNHYLGRVKSPKAAKQPTIKVRNVRVEGEGLEASVGAPPPTTTTAKPKAAPIPTTTTTTTTPKPQTTSTTTKKPTTTTTARPTTTKTTTTTIKPATVKTTTAKPTTTTTKRTVPTKPAPVEEVIPVDTKPPQKEKLKIINREGSHVEL